ncbi:hypothetical protein N7540_000139 [Penicillium herquei]|nr:hypothetical protein N7540_000139 [Penicillium herquei]
MSFAKPEEMSHLAGLSENEDLLMKVLLEQSNDLECGQYEKRGHTPLTFAASNGHENVVRILLDHGADIEKTNQSSSKIPTFLKLADRTPLAWAADNGHATVVRILLEAGADPNGRASDGGITPLATAAVRGYEDTVWVLLDQADIEFEQRSLEQRYPADDRTVLSHCAEDGQESMVARLLSKGADPNFQDPVGRSPLFWAAESGRTAVVSTLLVHGADLKPDGSKV